MAMPAAQLGLEMSLQQRVAGLEANAEHIRSDVSDIKLDLRRLNDKIDGFDAKLTSKIERIDTNLTGKIDGIDTKWTGQYDSLNEALTALALRVEKGFAELKVGRALDRVCWLLMSAALLGILARAFKWI